MYGGQWRRLGRRCQFSGRTSLIASFLVAMRPTAIPRRTNPETRSTQGGTGITHFTLATVKPRNSSQEARRSVSDVTTWINRLNIRHPIVQAPMAGTSTPRLAAAVSDAGGLGSLGIGACDAEQARQMIVETRALTSAASNVNLFCHWPARADARREAAWLARLAPEFERFGVEPPAGA
jgi:hypothetical protein